MLKRAIRIAGIDRAVFYALLNRGSTIGFNLVTLVLVVTRFSPVTQGYYYTFSSLLVLQTLLELGMGTVLVQFVSHEWSRLRFEAAGCLGGDELALRRIGALMRLALRWYAVVSIAFFVVVGTAGTFFLTRSGTSKGVVFPWWLLCAAFSFSIMQIPLRSALEGSDQIARVQRISTAVLSCASVAIWVAILAGMELYSLAISMATTAAVGLMLFGRASLPFLKLSAGKTDDSIFSWKREFWPQQWRIAVSWMSGFFMYQSFVPIIFYFQGAVPAGRMGASLQVYNAVNSVAMAWAYTKGPRMGILGARGHVLELKALVRGAFVRSSLAAVTFGAVVLFVFWLMHALSFRQDRFIGIDSMLLLIIAVVVLQRSNVETYAIRFQKIEPFVPVSVGSMVLILVSNVVLSKYYGLLAVCAGYMLVICGIMTPWMHKVYVSRIDRAVESRVRV